MRGALEVEIASIWKDVLGVREIAPNDDFFGLGGTSLHAARVVTKTRAAFGVKLSAETLYEQPTFADFAAHVGAARNLEAPA